MQHVNKSVLLRCFTDTVMVKAHNSVNMSSNTIVYFKHDQFYCSPFEIVHFSVWLLWYFAGLLRVAAAHLRCSLWIFFQKMQVEFFQLLQEDFQLVWTWKDSHSKKHTLKSNESFVILLKYQKTDKSFPYSTTFAL